MNVFISIDAPDVTTRLSRLSLVNEPVELRRVNQLTDLSRQMWRSWALSNGGTILTENGAAIRIEVPADYVDELEALQERYASALDSRVAIGVGTEVHQADRALEAAKALGGDLVLPYSEYVEEVLEGKPERSELETIAKSQVAMNQGAYSGATHPTAPKVEKPVPTQGEGNPTQAIYDLINDDERPSAPEGTHAAADFEKQLHAHAQAQEHKDKQDAVQSSAEVVAVKQKIAQALQLLQAQAPVMEQLKQSSPDTYQAMVTLAQSVVELARTMRSAEPMQKAEKPRLTATKNPMRVDDGDIYRYVSDIHTGSRADLNKVPMDTRFRLVDVPLERLPALRTPDNPHVQQYASLKTPFPPIVIGNGGSIPDGHHRIAAARLRGDKSIRAYVPEAEVGGYVVAPKKAPAKKPVKKQPMKKAEFVEGKYPETADDVEIFEYFRAMHTGGRGNLIKSVPYDQEYKLMVLPVSDLVSGVSMDNAQAQKYARMPTPFPPIIMKTDGNQPLDGNHRLTAARIRGEETIRAYIPKGSELMAKAALPMPEASAHHHQNLPVGSRVDYKQKVQHGDGSSSWVQMRAGMIMSRDGHPISSRNPKGR